MNFVKLLALFVLFANLAEATGRKRKKADYGISDAQIKRESVERQLYRLKTNYGIEFVDPYTLCEIATYSELKEALDSLNNSPNAFSTVSWGEDNILSQVNHVHNIVSNKNLLNFVPDIQYFDLGIGRLLERAPSVNYENLWTLLQQSPLYEINFLSMLFKLLIEMCPLDEVSFPDETDEELNTNENAKRDHLILFLSYLAGNQNLSSLEEGIEAVEFTTNSYVSSMNPRNYAELNYKLFNVYKSLQLSGNSDIAKIVFQKCIHAGRHCHNAKESAVNQMFTLLCTELADFHAQYFDRIAKTTSQKMLVVLADMKKDAISKVIEDKINRALREYTKAASDLNQVLELANHYLLAGVLVDLRVTFMAKEIFDNCDINFRDVLGAFPVIGTLHTLRFYLDKAKTLLDYEIHQLTSERIMFEDANWNYWATLLNFELRGSHERTPEYELGLSFEDIVNGGDLRPKEYLKIFMRKYGATMLAQEFQSLRFLLKNSEEYITKRLASEKVFVPWNNRDAFGMASAYMDAFSQGLIN